MRELRHLPRAIRRPFFFFFQAEDGIRDWSVTGVQTCALPISSLHQKLKKQSTAPVPGATSDSPPGRARQRILFVARWPPSDSKNLFSRQETCVVRKIRNVIGKNFQQHCT